MGGVLDGHVAVITGAASGIGLATARLFYAEGAQVVLADISGKEADIASQLGERAIAINADVSKSEQVKAMIDGAVENFGGIDILCNVAGVSGQMTNIIDQTEDNFDLMVNVNLRSVFMAMKYAIPEMIKRKAGSIINVSSTAGIKALAERGTYAAVKAGVIALTKVAAVEYAKLNVRANAICPGVIKTPMYDIGMQRNPEMVARFQRLTPMDRPGTPEEVADAMLFLGSRRSSFITGTVLPIEGGQTA